MPGAGIAPVAAQQQFVAQAVEHCLLLERRGQRRAVAGGKVAGRVDRDRADGFVPSALEFADPRGAALKFSFGRRQRRARRRGIAGQCRKPRLGRNRCRARPRAGIVTGGGEPRGKPLFIGRSQPGKLGLEA